MPILCPITCAQENVRYILVTGCGNASVVKGVVCGGKLKRIHHILQYH